MIQYRKYSLKGKIELSAEKGNNGKRKPRERRLSLFGRAVIIYVFCLVSVLACLLGVLCAFLYTYEKYLPEKTAFEVASSIDKAEMGRLIEESAGDFGEFEDAELIIQRTEHLSGKVSVQKLAKEYTSDRPVYRLMCGDKDIGKLSLRVAEKKAAFGIRTYEKENLFLYPESVPGAVYRTEVKAVVPQGAELFINGKKVEKEHLLESSAPYGGEITVPYGTLCDIYEVEELCLVPQLEAVVGSETSPLTVNGGRADWFAEKERTFVLTIPSDAELLICGKAPDRSVAKKGDLGSAVSQFERELGDALPKMLSYTVLSIGEEDIEVSVNGEPLFGEVYDNNGVRELVYLYSEESKFKVSAVIPAGSVLYINGIKVGEEYFVGESEFDGLSGVKYLSAQPVLGNLYEIDGLLCQPKITAKIGGSEIPVCALSRNERIFKAEFYGAVVEMEAVKNAADEFVRAYFHYVANGAVGIEENYEALISLMKEGSPAYRQIQRSKSSFEFVNQGVYTINNIKPRDFIKLSSGLVYCVCDYSVHLRFYRNEKLYEGTLSLIFTEENGALRVCDMVIDSDG